MFHVVVKWCVVGLQSEFLGQMFSNEPYSMALGWPESDLIASVTAAWLIKLHGHCFCFHLNWDIFLSSSFFLSFYYISCCCALFPPLLHKWSFTPLPYQFNRFFSLLISLIYTRFLLCLCSALVRNLWGEKTRIDQHVGINKKFFPGHSSVICPSDQQTVFLTAL